MRAAVLAGAHRLWEPDRPADVVVVACGPVVPEALAAAARLEQEGVAALVLDITSPDRLYRGWRESTQQAARGQRPHPCPSTTSARC